MEALVPAFVAALLTQLGERPAMLAAILADRYGRPFLVTLGAVAAHAAGNLVAVLGAMAVAPLLNPDARMLMLAVALVVGGLGGIWPAKPPARMEKWRAGSLLTAFLGVLALAAGDRTQFLTFAIAVRGEPWFALAGAVAGTFAVTFVAAYLGELGWGRIPLRILRAVMALAMLVAGVVTGAGAFHLL
ncbi:TMEM165/GDT1 family protein [Sphingomonas canadensis]|uniref:GDT1 family protein n=1 Tax=Sphingomonas canadensis TaxID=1219257 RepID=A0ABW3H651_9SPHN|nr:TMEM165/GDT1 family protein [Sphingomonas canadensis]MCW3835217.1 TMEM165/GDT1 family protein [Sphingomonas canadensis]